jgi:hypothetical protein
VYTEWLVGVAILGVTLVLPSPTRGQVDLTVDPAMMKGAAAAKVTIIEFSDYQ